MEIIQDLRPAEEIVWDYYGTPLKAMRRTQLWRLADIHNIPYPAGCSKENLLKLMEHEEVRGNDLLKAPAGMTQETFWKLINGPKRQLNELGGMLEKQTNVDVLRDALEGKSYFETEEAPEADDIGQMPWHALKKRAKEEGHKVLPGMKRPEIEALLRG